MPELAREIGNAGMNSQWREDAPLRSSSRTFLTRRVARRFCSKRRWPSGFVCPACGKSRVAALKSRPRLLECLDCGRQTSITAGTSARQLEDQLGVTYKTAWLLSQKLRQSMADPNRDLLEGVVEVDQAEIPFRAGDTFFEPGNAGKILIAGAIEVIERDTSKPKPRRKGAKYLDTRSGRLRLAMIADNSAASIEAFVRANVKPGTTLITDGHASYPGTVCGLPARSAHRWCDGGQYCPALDTPRLFADEALGAGHVSRPTPQTHRHLSQ